MRGSPAHTSTVTHPVDPTDLSWRRFARHYIEMVIAMVVGMVAFAPVGWLAKIALGQPAWTAHIVTTTLLMATGMTLGMTVWMRHRGHDWASTAEMGAAMYASFAVLYPAYIAGAMSASDLMEIGHMLMLPAMLVVMLRRRSEYARAHH